MHFTKYASLAAALGAVSTVALPAEQPGAGQPGGLPPLPNNLGPGIHSYTFDDAGNTKIKRVADLDTVQRSVPVAENSAALGKRVNTWTGCENYALTIREQDDVTHAWASLSNWASSNSNGESPWINGHYFAMTDSGVFAYLCEWGNGNHATVNEIAQAQGVLDTACYNTGGIHQWNEWKKGLGIAVTGQKWCNGVSPV